MRDIAGGRRERWQNNETHIKNKKDTTFVTVGTTHQNISTIKQTEMVDVRLL